MIETLGSIGDFAGGVGVIVTLIYLAIQIRQNTQQLDHNSELVQASAELETARLLAEFHASAANSPDLARLWNLMTTPDLLNDTERARLLWFLGQYLFVVEGLYRQFRRGFLPEESWVPHERALAGVLQVGWISEWFDSRIAPLSDEFHATASLLRDTPPGGAWEHTIVGHRAAGG
ncbi:MAG TPA: hypothetical protein VLB07_11070 [Woeseiaceae bacterium]|nr:hypothetical protein [Woeseiaceae bacterium]